MYTYKAFVSSVYDADTITVDVDVGFHVVLHKIKLRLCDINAPEVRGSEKADGIISRDWLIDRILKKDIILKTRKEGRGRGKYGRWLGEIFDVSEISDKSLVSQSINNIMVSKGLVKRRDYQ